MFSDHGQCNVTFHGDQYLGGYYGASLLKPSAISPFGPHPGASFYCTYTFQGVPGQRVMMHVKKLRVGHYDYTENR